MINHDGNTDNEKLNIKRPSSKSDINWEILLDSFSSSTSCSSKNLKLDTKQENIVKSCVDVQDESYLVACIMMLTTNRNHCKDGSNQKSKGNNVYPCNTAVKEAFTKSRYAERLHDFIQRILTNGSHQQQQRHENSCLNHIGRRDEELSDMYLRLALELLSIVFFIPTTKDLATNSTVNYEPSFLYYWADRHAFTLWHVLRDNNSNVYSLEITTILTLLINFKLRNNRLNHSFTHNEKIEEEKLKSSGNFVEGNNWINQFMEWLLANYHQLVPSPNDDKKKSLEEEMTEKMSNTVNNNKDNHSHNDVGNKQDKTTQNCKNQYEKEDDENLFNLLKSIFLSSRKPILSMEKSERNSIISRQNLRICLQTCFILQLTTTSSLNNGNDNDYNDYNTLDIAPSILQSFYESCRSYFFHQNGIKNKTKEDAEEFMEIWAICIFILYYTFDPNNGKKKYSADFIQIESNLFVELCIMGMTYQQNFDNNIGITGNHNYFCQMTIYIMATMVENHGIQWMIRHNHSEKHLNHKHCNNSNLLRTEKKTSSMGLATMFCTLLRLVVGEIRVVLGKHVDENDNETTTITISSFVSNTLLNGIRFALVALQKMSQLAMKYDDTCDLYEDCSTITNDSVDDNRIWNEHSIQHIQLSLQDLAHSTKEFILYFSLFRQDHRNEKIKEKYADVEFMAIQCASYLGAFYSQVNLNWSNSSPSINNPPKHIPRNFEQNKSAVNIQQDDIEEIISVLSTSVQLLTKPKSLSSRDQIENLDENDTDFDSFNFSSPFDLLSHSKKTFQHREPTILCLIPCIISILLQCTDIYPNPPYNDEESTNEFNNKKQTYPSMIYSKLFQSTNIMNPILVQYMTDFHKEVCQKQKQQKLSYNLSKLSWCLILIDTWCQFMAHFPMLHQHNQGKNEVNSCKELLLNGLFPWLETLIKLSNDKNPQGVGYEFENILQDCAQTATTVLDYYIMILIDNNDTCDFSNLHMLQTKCEYLTAQVSEMNS